MIKVFDAPNSSHIKRLEFGTAGECLRVEYKDGRIYTFHDVPKEVYEELIIAPSVGKYLNEFVYEQYPFKRIK